MCSKKWIVAVLAFALMSCTSQSTPVPTIGLLPIPLPTLTGTNSIENEGTLCFQEYENTATIVGYFLPRGCFSSSCWQLVDKSLSVRVMEDTNQIRFYTRVTLRDFSIVNGEHVSCTTDCSNTGEISFDLSNVSRGKYSIWLGEKQVGEFSNTQKTVTQSKTCLGQAY
jgi:hypothetical protein